MKFKIYAYFLMLVLIFYILRPVLPYIEYAVNKDYIAKNLCINRHSPHSCCEGKCYLEKQIKRSTETSDSKENNTNNKIQNEDVKEFLSSNITNPKVFETMITRQIKPETFTRSSIVRVIFVPPRV